LNTCIHLRRDGRSSELKRGRSLTGYNPRLSGRPFLDKRDHPEGGSSTSHLRLNQGLGADWSVGIWTPCADAARALDPNVSQEILKLTIAYKAETNGVDIVSQTGIAW
jgi:hypothetical protein